MSIRRVIYLVESPFTPRDYERFGLRVLAEAGLSVEVWDVHHFFLPRDDAAEIERASGCVIREFTSMNDLTKACEALTNDTAVILLCAVYVGEFARYRPLLRALMRGDGVLATIASGARPPIPVSPVVRPSTAGRVRRSIESMRTGQDSIGALVRMAVSKTRARGFIVASRLRPGTVRPLAWIWAGVSIDTIDPLLVGAETRVHLIHTLDFDRILSGDGDVMPATSSIVYLDAMGPLHPDFPVLGINLEVGAEEWFAAINTGLDLIEDSTGERVVVAAHPRAQAGSMEQWYQGRTVEYGTTESLIRNSSSVVISDPTTSIGMVAWHRRPVTVLRGRRLFDTHLIELDQYANLLNFEVVDLDSMPPSWQRPAVDEVAYESFVTSYIKRADTPMLPFWEVVASDLLGADDGHRTGGS